MIVFLRISRWDTWEDLRRYWEGVAGSVGEMCVSVMGLRAADTDRAAAVSHARALGVAMQLTNVLRDVGEDARRGRCYLPAEELARHGFSHDDVVTGRALRRRVEWREFMRHQVARAREHYAFAAPGIAMLGPDARRCATACAVGYARILEVIERNGYDSHSRRASLGWGERARLLVKKPIEKVFVCLL